MMTNTDHNPARDHAITLDRPAPDFFDGVLLGNGGLGAVVTTRPDAIAVHFGHNDIWDIRVSMPSRDAVGTFSEVLAKLEAGDLEWFRAYRGSLEGGYKKPYPRPYPCGTLVLGVDRRRVEILGHELSLEDGVCRVKVLLDGQRSDVLIFVDQASDRLWWHCEGPGDPVNRVRLVPDVEGLEVGKPTTLAQNAVGLTVPGEPPFRDNVSLPDNPPDNVLSFAERLPALETMATDAADKGFRVLLSAAGPLKTFERSDWYGGFTPNGRLERRAEAGAATRGCVRIEHGLASDIADLPVDADATKATDYDRTLSASRESWAAFWQRSAVSLGDKTLERAWYRNTYFVNCALRAGVTCPGLFGNWSLGEIGTAWHGDYHMNYNTQQVFWGLFSSNHVEHHIPYVDLITRLTPSAKNWAKTYYEMEGAAYPHSAFPIDTPLPPYQHPPWTWEICETPWAVQSLWWHYTYTLDTDYLRSVAFDPIRAATQFIVAYLTRPAARDRAKWGDDLCHVYPTVVPEIYQISEGLRFNADCLADITLIKFLLKAYLEAVDVLDAEATEGSTPAGAREVLDNLPAYETAATPDGDVLVSVRGEDPDIVYNIPIPGMTVFPGEEHGLGSPPEVRDLVTRSLQRQRLEGGNEVVFANLQAARMGVLDVEKFKRQLAYCELPNGSYADQVLEINGRYGDTTPFEFMKRMGVWVENFAVPAVINECLLQSHDGVLRFFPNWPGDQDARFTSLRAVGAFLVSATFRDGTVAEVEVLSEKGGTLQFISPWAAGTARRDSARESFSDGLVQLQMAPNETVRLTAA